MAVYGIDLGTTYSCLCKFEGGHTTVIEAYPGDKAPLPSAVYFGEGGNIEVGEEAKEHSQTEGHRVIQFIKREIGKPYPPHEMDGKEYNAIEISALILKKIAKYAAEQGENVKDVVITCPAYFGNEERDATKKAGLLAGFNVLEIINEPTAAAISYASNNLKNEVVAVYDLGGGTFDVTILKIEVKANGVPSCTVIATDGDDTLGGKDWDDELSKIIQRNMMEENGVSELTIDDIFAITSITEKTKRALTERQSTTVRAVIGGQTMSCEVTRAEFEEATSFLLKKTTDCLDRVLTSPAVRAHKISKILLVGGSSRMPMVLNKIKQCYGDAEAMNQVGGFSDDPYTESIPVFISDPDTAVCKGAAIFANMLANAAKKRSGGFSIDEPQIEIHDIASRTFGVDTFSGDGQYLSNLIFKGQEIPCSVTKNFYPVNDNQSGVLFYVYESITDEEMVPLKNDRKDGTILEVNPAYGIKLLGKLYLKFPPNVSKSTALITTMGASGSGSHISVTNSLTNESASVDIEFKNNDVDLDHNHINALSID